MGPYQEKNQNPGAGPKDRISQAGPHSVDGSIGEKRERSTPEADRASRCGNRSTDQRGAEPVTIRTSAGMLKPDAVKYRLDEARTSSLNCALCSGGILRSLS